MSLLILWNILPSPLTPWDPVGLPLDPLGPCRPTLWAYPLTPWNPDRLAGLFSPVWSCFVVRIFCFELRLGNFSPFWGSHVFPGCITQEQLCDSHPLCCSMGTSPIFLQKPRVKIFLKNASVNIRN